MNEKFKYSLIASAVLALSFCQGHRGTVFDPTGGANYQNAAQLLSQPYTQQVLPGASRSQTFSVNYTQADWDRCGREGQAEADGKGTASAFCQQLFYNYQYQNGLVGNAPEQVGINFQNPGTVTGSNPNVYNFDWQDFANNNRTWVNQYQQYMGGPAYNGGVPAYGTFRTPINMHTFCNDSSTVTTIQYNSNCGQTNYSYGVINLQGNQAYNRFLKRDFSGAEQFYGPQGIAQKRYPVLYTSVLARSNITGQNKQLKKTVKDDWTQLKGIPAHMGLSILDRLMNVGASMATKVETQVDANLSRVEANNYAAAGYNQQQMAYNDQVSNAYNNIYQISGYTTTQAMDPKKPCSQDKFHYVVGTQPESSAEYKVFTCDE